MNDDLDIKKLQEEAEQEYLDKKEEEIEALDVAPLVEFPEVQKVEVTNQVEIPETEKVDLTTVEQTLTGILNKLNVKTEVDLGEVEKRLKEILIAVDKEIEEKPEIDYSDLLTAIKEALPSSFDYDEYFERLEEKLKDLDISKEIKEGLKGFHSSGWLPVVQAVNDLETTTTDGSAKCSIAAQDSFSIDAFGRWRVSEPTTIFDSKQLYDNAPLFWDDQEVSGGGTSSTHSTARASTTIGVSATTAGKRVRQTFMRFNYQPGKSQLILLTGVLGSQPTDVAARFGLFDDNDGIFLVNTAGINAVGIRSNVTGTPTDTLIAQANWNIDPMDGTGPSGVTLDVDKANIFFIDFEWLGVGRVRVGFVVDGKIYYVHAFNHANNITSVYMSTPNLPLRYEIQAGGTNPSDATLEHICSSVMSEGGIEENGVLQYHSTGGTHIDAANENTIYAILGGRLKSTHTSASINIIDVTVLETTGSKELEWLLIANPTVAGTFTYNDKTNSAMQVANGATANTVTGGYTITGGFMASANKGGASGSQITNAVRPGAAIDGTVDEFVIAVRPVAGSSNIDIEASVTWRELL